jgi:hypothetical protein
LTTFWAILLDASRLPCTERAILHGSMWLRYSMSEREEHVWRQSLAVVPALSSSGRLVYTRVRSLFAQKPCHNMHQRKCTDHPWLC